MQVEVKNISKKYRDIHALKEMNIVFTHGVWGLLGANGAGKSTLMEILVGNKVPTNGEIFLNGKSIKKLDGEYRTCIGYLPQNFSSGTKITVTDYLEYVAALKGLERARAKQRIKYLVELLELQEYRHKYVDRLSGGTKQRVGVAQALLNDPEILVLDEPTSGLDPKERIRLRGIISKMGKEKIIILSTHIVSDIESIANKNIILKRGRMIDIGTTEMLLSTIYGKVWEVIVPIDQIEDFEKKYTVINIRTVEQNVAVIRFIADNCKVANAKKQEPKLEDYYLWSLKQK